MKEERGHHRRVSYGWTDVRKVKKTEMYHGDDVDGISCAAFGK